jgi:hypothetical protein
MTDLVNTTLSVRLALTLLNSLWEGAAIALLARTLALAFRRSTAAVRYQIYFTALVCIALAAVVTFACLAPTPSASARPEATSIPVSSSNTRSCFKT